MLCSPHEHNIGYDRVMHTSPTRTMTVSGLPYTLSYHTTPNEPNAHIRATPARYLTPDERDTSESANHAKALKARARTHIPHLIPLNELPPHATQRSARTKWAHGNQPGQYIAEITYPTPRR